MMIVKTANRGIIPQTAAAGGSTEPLRKELTMSKWMSVLTLGAALAICGCKNHDNDMDHHDNMNEPKKMSVASDAKPMKADSSKCTECTKSK
jgi:hypothetical protein